MYELYSIIDKYVSVNYKTISYGTNVNCISIDYSTQLNNTQARVDIILINYENRFYGYGYVK